MKAVEHYRDGEQHNFRKLFVAKDGQRYWCWLSVFFPDDGEPFVTAEMRRPVPQPRGGGRGKSRAHLGPGAK